MSNFIYPHTCNIIDGCIGDIKDNIERYFSNEFEDLINPNEIEAIVEAFYNITISDGIEKIRSTNIDMRNAAEKQIDSLIDLITELKAEL